MSHNDPHNVHEDKRYDQMAVNGVSKATQASEKKKRYSVCLTRTTKIWYVHNLLYIHV